MRAALGPAARVRVQTLKGARHGEFLARPEYQAEGVDSVRSLQRAGWRRAGMAPPVVCDLRVRLRDALPRGVPASLWEPQPGEQV